jgi:hypothetical protein
MPPRASVASGARERCASQLASRSSVQAWIRSPTRENTTREAIVRSIDEWMGRRHAGSRQTTVARHNHHQRKIQGGESHPVPFGHWEWGIDGKVKLRPGNG